MNRKTSDKSSRKTKNKEKSDYHKTAEKRKIHRTIDGLFRRPRSRREKERESMGQKEKGNSNRNPSIKSEKDNDAHLAFVHSFESGFSTQLDQKSKI